MKTYLIEHVITGAPVSELLMLVIGVVSCFGFYNKTLFLTLIQHPFGIVHKKEYYRLFTGDFVHNDSGHLLMNEIMMYLTCVNLEEALNQRSAFGSLQFVTIYGISCLTGIIVTTIRHRNDFSFSGAGASGSILGCMMSFMILKPRYIALYLPVFGGVKNIYMALLFILILIIYQVRTDNTMMNNELHLYSALGGIVATLMLFPQLI
jgi:membrane associated rhomboid family serine protease